MPPPSLLRQLQASCLLAVLAGYGVLLLAHRQLAVHDRRARHLQAAGQVRMELSERLAQPTAEGAEALLRRSFTPGRMLWLEVATGVPYRTPTPDATFPVPAGLPRLLAEARSPGNGGQVRAFSLAGRSYLSSGEPLALRGGPARLWLLEDVTADTERERTRQLLLLAAAGLTALLTSALLRLVLRRGLQPLDALGARVEAFNAESLSSERLPLTGQPQELTPIVEAFNGLLDRLALGRERQQAFVDGVAHELRTPITLISGYAQSLRRHADAAGRLDASDLAPLGLIEAEGRRMGRLVADLLDIAREDAGRLELRRAPLDVDDALLEAFERLAPLAGGRLVLYPPPGDDGLALGDPERLQQCLTNLVENALKYTPADQTIELFRSRTGTQVIAHVRDHGPGVPEADRERIFGRFVRGSSAASGSGIGLAVVKLLMARMDGQVRVVETSGGGAEFQLGLEPALGVYQPEVICKA